MRDLLVAANERQAREWDQTAAILTMIANTNSGKGKKFRINDFHPMLESKRKMPTEQEHQLCFKAMRNMYLRKEK